MHDKNLDKLVEKAGSKYTLVVAVAKRAQQIRAGAVPTIDVGSKNPVTIALAEIANSDVLVNPDELVVPTPEKSPEVEEIVDDDLDLFGVELGGDLPDDYDEDLADEDLDDLE